MNDTSRAHLLQARGVTKIFPGVTALDHVDFDLYEGEVHCIVGENGAGKSTLIKCLTGVYTPESGSIEIDGEDALANTSAFQQVALVPQEIDLFPEMTLAENLLMPFERTGVKTPVRASALNRQAAPVLEEYGINGEPDSLVKHLSVADQQLLQIARASQLTAKVLILDEPTSSLTEDDAERVFEVVRKAQARGVGVIYISHKLDELAVIGNRVSVFRNGKSVDEAPMKEASREWLVRQMTGRDIAWTRTFVPEGEPGDVVLSVENASGHRFEDISFELRAGEVLGLSGLVGAGRTELMLGIYGYAPLYSGAVTIDGETVTANNPTRSLRKGLAYLPEDRKRMGILPFQSVASNISVLSLDRFSAGGFVNARKEASTVKDSAKEYDVRAPSLETSIRLLSGGNQQKAIIARTMMMGPKVVILDEPTKGIDVAAKFEIYALMRRLAEEEGLGLILVSSELDEIIHCCNRVIVMHQGRMQGEFAQPLNKEELVGAMFGPNKENGEDNE